MLGKFPGKVFGHQLLNKKKRRGGMGVKILEAVKDRFSNNVTYGSTHVVVVLMQLAPISSREWHY